MTAPAFEFTTRAAPVVQFGRPERPTGDAMWQTGLWGTGHWGKADWEPLLWTDLTCEIHEIRTVTGRGSASDRFVPGTAHIVASNVNEVADMIFPRVPGPAYESELVPQPPITNEEELQAPAAATVVSNGWSFTDDFESRPPRWVFPPAWTATGVAPYGPFKLIDEGWEPELYRTTATANYLGNAVAQYTRNYDPAGNSSIGITMTNVGWPTAPTGGTPELVVDLMLRMNTTDKQCDLVRFRLKPIYGGGPNQMFIDLVRMNPDGSTPTLSTTPHTTNTGANGIFGTVTLAASVDYLGNLSGTAYVGTAGVASLNTTVTPLDAGRVGVAMHYEQGVLTVEPGAPRIEAVALIDTVTGDDFTDDLSRQPGSGWRVPERWRSAGYEPMLMDGGALIPNQEFSDIYNGQYTGRGFAQWSSEFDGDQFWEMEVTNVSKPRPNGAVGGTAMWFEIYLHSHRQDLACRVVRVAYDPGYGTSDNVIWWQLWLQGPNGEEISDTTYGELIVGDTDGVFDEPDRIRVESDVDGEVRLYRRGVLLETVVYEDPPTGGRIGVSTSWEADNLFPNDQRRPPVARIEQVWAGLREPLGTEELGIWIRIGVDHSTLGNQWFLRGCVDGIVPTYVPERPDAVRIECIDTLGEAGRVRILGDQLPHEFANATTRIHQILNKAHWPRNLMIIREDETVMSRPSNGKAVDALTAVAESCGGAIWSDPRNGNIVFKGQDWQGEVAGGPAIAVITNTDPEGPAIDAPRVCPTGWERSSRREDMNTRVRYSSVSSQGEDREPLIREWRAPNAESIYGVELYERTLLCTTGDRLNELARRQLRLRHPNQFPRVEAVLLDAATADEALDLMTMANWMIPSKYRCQLRRAGTYVFNRSYLVTGIQHTMSPERWTCRLALDIASAFAETGGRWDEARWGTPGDTWGRSR